MPRADGIKALAVLLTWAMVATTLLAVTPTANAGSSDVSTAEGVASVAPATASGGGDVPDALSRIDARLRELATAPGKGFVDVVIHTADVPSLAAVLERVGARQRATIDEVPRDVPFVARPWGAVGWPTTVRAQVPVGALAELAGTDAVMFVEPPRFAQTAAVFDSDYYSAQAGLQALLARAEAGLDKSPVQIADARGSASPTAWAIARAHNAWDVWNLGYEGGGVYVAIVDTGEDFGHPSLQGQWAVDLKPGSPWNGWPIMFHPASMEGLFGPTWTAGSDVDRVPLPFWQGTNDGDVWYTNTDYRANDSDADGFLEYRHRSLGPDGELRYTPKYNPQQYGNWGANWNAEINRSYWIGRSGDLDQIRSASGIYRLGVHRDDTLTGLWGEKVGMLLVDSATPFVYDTVYVDLNFNLNFTDDKPVTKADPIAVADLTGDGIPDISGGLLYFIASSTPVTGEVVLSPIAGTETTAQLAKRLDLNADGIVESTSAATDILGLFSFRPPVSVHLRNPAGTRFYLPGATENVYEEFRGVLGDESGVPWFFGGPQTSFGPINLLSFQPVDTATLLRGVPDFSIDFVYNLGLCDRSPIVDPTATCSPLTRTVDYDIDLATGMVVFWFDVPMDWIVFVNYQLASYTIEPVSGTLSFSRTLPAGWSLEADYEYGLPVPYSQVYGPSKGYDTLIPANGDLVAFHGDFDYNQNHGSFVSSTVVARPFGNPLSTALEVFGVAPEAKIIGIAACCNVPGPLNLFGSVEDQRTFAALGYDGLPGTGDEAAVMSNSFGNPFEMEAGFHFSDRWMLDYWRRYPLVTSFISLGNSGPGYGSGHTESGSPGAIGVGAGYSNDWMYLIGDSTGSGYWEVPVCPPAPFDPKDCVGFGSPNGPGPYGDPAYFSSRGPNLLGLPKPDILAVGAWALEAAPLNIVASVPSGLDGTQALGFFGGTSQASPVAAGIAALMVDAYRATHGGATPTNDMVKVALKSGADDLHMDVLQQGPGWANALRSVRAMADMDGITATPDYWTPGGYQGVSRPGFVNLLAPGTSDTATVAVANHHPTSPKTVDVSDGVFQRMAAPTTWALSLPGPGNQDYVLKRDGIYASDGATRLQALSLAPYWDAADFVRVTFAYDAAVFSGSTSLFLNVYNWNDSNGDARYDGVLERNRFSFNGNSPNAESVWATVFSPGARVHDGLVLTVRTSTSTSLAATLIVEFYERADWAWITASAPSVTVGAGGTITFNVTAAVPPGTPAGYYEGAIYLSDGADLTTIPVIVNVPATPGFPVLLGGNAPATALYSNDGMIQGRRTGSTGHYGDNRFVWAEYNVVPAEGRRMIYNAILQGVRSEPEMRLFRLAADPVWTNDTLFGPGTLALHRETQFVLGQTDTPSSSREFMQSDAEGGVFAFQVRSYGARADVEAFEANIGIMQTAPLVVPVQTNEFAGSAPGPSIWSNVPLYNGLAAITTASRTTVKANLPLRQDDPDNPFTSSYVERLDLSGAITVDVSIVGRVGDDIDLFLLADGGNGVFDPSDAILCSAIGPTEQESCSLTLPPDGVYWAAIHGWSIPSGTTTFTLTVEVSTLGVSAFTARNIPTATVPAYTPTGFEVEWDYPFTLAEGNLSGALLVSPGYTPFSLVQLVQIAFHYDVTPPSIDPARDLTPFPNSAIRDPFANVAANVNDPGFTGGELDRFSVQLIVDGVDVTHLSKVVAPYGTNRHSLLTIAWEHPDQAFPDGRHSAIVRAADVEGNFVTEVWSWVVDTTAPGLAITAPVEDAWTSAPSFAFEARTEPGASVTVTQNSVPVAALLSPEGRITAALTLVEGLNEIIVTSADALGNSATATRRIVLDTTSPVVSAIVDVPSPTNRRSTTVTGTVNEAVDVVTVSGVQATVATDGTFSAVVPLVEGENRISIVTHDRAGNEGRADLPVLIRDTIAPTVSLDPLPPSISSLATQTVTISGSVSDPDVFFVTVNGVPVVRDPTGRFAKTFDLAVGDNVFVVQAEDDAGNTAQAVTSVAYTPVVTKEVANYNSVIASGVAVVLLIVGFVVGYMLSGGARPPKEEAAGPPEETPPEEEPAEEPAEGAAEEEEL